MKNYKTQPSGFIPHSSALPQVSGLSPQPSDSAIQINIQIMRAFTKLRQLIFDSADLRREIEELRHETDGRFRIVFQTLEQLLTQGKKPQKKIGFTAKEKEVGYGE